jgi:hypothetical protein
MTSPYRTTRPSREWDIHAMERTIKKEASSVVPVTGTYRASKRIDLSQPPVVSPPITCSTVPVMYEESALDARKT